MSGHGLRSTVFPSRRGRGLWAVPLLLFLAVVLVAALAFNLANLDTGGEAIPDVPDAGGPPPGSEGLVTSDPLSNAILISILVVLAIATIYAFLRAKNQKGTPMKAPSWWEIVSSFIGMIVIIALLFTWPRVVRAFQGTVGDASPPGTGGGSAVGWPTAAGLPAGIFLLGSLLAAFLVLAFMIRRAAATREPEVADLLGGLRSRRAAAEAVREAMDDLELGGDIRGAILVCYQRFCALLAGRGIEAQEALTPRELSVLAIERLGVSTEEADVLTSLFEVARYSDHTLGEPDRERALASLEHIRSALEA